MRRLYFVGAYQDFTRFLHALKEAGYLDLTGSGNTPEFTARLSLHGWELVEQLTRFARIGSQAFVAMWFHDGLEPLFDIGIAPALRACGYSPYRVDRMAHGNRIDDEIIAQIRSSRLLIADLTGLRPNAFYETGFAHGLGMPIILCCNEAVDVTISGSDPTIGSTAVGNPHTWFKHVADQAFDIRQYTVLGWKEPAGLATALESRIRALNLALA